MDAGKLGLPYICKQNYAPSELKNEYKIAQRRTKKSKKSLERIACEALPVAMFI